MIPTDIVECKEVLKSTGVMGSTLKKQKLFEGLALVLSVRAAHTKIMLTNYKLMIVKTKYLNIVCTLNASKT